MLISSANVCVCEIQKTWSNAQPDTPMRDHNCMRGAIRLCNIYEIVHSVLCVVLYNILMQNATMFQSTAYIQVANIPYTLRYIANIP